MRGVPPNRDDAATPRDRTRPTGLSLTSVLCLCEEPRRRSNLRPCLSLHRSVNIRVGGGNPLPCLTGSSGLRGNPADCFAPVSSRERGEGECKLTPCFRRRHHVTTTLCHTSAGWHPGGERELASGDTLPSACTTAIHFLPVFGLSLCCANGYPDRRGLS